MKKKKNSFQSTDEVIVFSNDADEYPQQKEAVEDREAREEPEALNASRGFASIDIEETDKQEIKGKKKKTDSFKFLKSFKNKKDKKAEESEQEPLLAENTAEEQEEEAVSLFEESEAVMVEVDNSEYEAETDVSEQESIREETNDEQSAEITPDLEQEDRIEYAKSVDDLPVAEESDDVYADIVKNIDDSIHKERTSRQAKYEREQHFIDAENPFQRDRESLAEGEDTLSYEEIKRKELKTFDEMFDSLKSKILPRKGEKKSESIRKIVANTAVFVLICCAIAFVVIYAQSKQAVKQQLGLSSQVVDITSAEEEEKLWEEFHSKYPNVKTPEGMMAKYAYLYAINQQLVGWVSVPNSGIDVQVVQSQNNSDYLKKDFYGNYSRYGCPFMDYRNDPRYLNQNTIIYGHHMSDGLIFAELSKYKELDGFLESPIICFDTLYKTYYFKIYAAFITNTREEDDNGYIFNYTVTSFASTQNFDDYISALDERKLYTTGVDINSGDKLLTLSTCTYEFNDARLVIVGRMLRTGETVDIDTTYATKNGNPHYPQVWYDKKGTTNPFAGAAKWYPEG